MIGDHNHEVNEFTLLTFMHWSLPRTSDAHVLAVRGSFLALLHLVTFQGLAGEFSVAKLTFVGQFGDCLLDSQIAGGRAL